MVVTLYEYPKCNDCRKAKQWLEQKGVHYKTIHLAAEPPSLENLRDLWLRSGLPIRDLFNSSGAAYQSGVYDWRLESMDEDDALEELVANGMLIQRPILDNGKNVLVGFNETTYQEIFG